MILPITYHAQVLQMLHNRPGSSRYGINHCLVQGTLLLEYDVKDIDKNLSICLWCQVAKVHCIGPETNPGSLI